MRNHECGTLRPDITRAWSCAFSSQPYPPLPHPHPPSDIFTPIPTLTAHGPHTQQTSSASSTSSYHHPHQLFFFFLRYDTLCVRLRFPYFPFYFPGFPLACFLLPYPFVAFNSHIPFLVVTASASSRIPNSTQPKNKSPHTRAQYSPLSPPSLRLITQKREKRDLSWNEAIHIRSSAANEQG